MNLAYLLAARNRWGIMEHIATEYNLLVDAYQGIEHAEVTTAVPIDEEDERHLEKRLEEIIGKKTVVSTRVNPAIMGGLVTKVGDRLLDGSTRTKLLALKRSMIEGTR
jgi:F-type H+-transporting ATPase subunit delta